MADTSKAGNLIAELRGCLTKLGEAVDQPTSKHVASVPNGGDAHRGGSATSDDVEKRIAAAEEGRRRAEKLMFEALEAKEAAERRAEEAEQARNNVQQLLSWVHEAEKKKKNLARQNSGGRDGFQTALKIALGDDEEEEVDLAVLAPDEAMLRAVFDQWDTDSNGSLSEEELCSALRQLRQKVSASELASLMAWLDRDGDHTVDFGEFKRAALAPSQVEVWLGAQPVLKLLASNLPGGSDGAPLEGVAALSLKDVRGRVADMVEPLAALLSHAIHRLNHPPAPADAPDPPPAHQPQEERAEGAEEEGSEGGQRREEP